MKIWLISIFRKGKEEKLFFNVAYNDEVETLEVNSNILKRLFKKKEKVKGSLTLDDIKEIIKLYIKERLEEREIYEFKFDDLIGVLIE